MSGFTSNTGKRFRVNSQFNTKGHWVVGQFIWEIEDPILVSSYILLFGTMLVRNL